MIIRNVCVAFALASAFLAADAGAGSPSHDRNISVTPQKAASIAVNSVVAEDGRANVIILLNGEPAVFSYSRTLIAGGNGTLAQTSANNAAHVAITNLTSAQSSFVTALKASGIQYDELYR